MICVYAGRGRVGFRKGMGTTGPEDDSGARELNIFVVLMVDYYISKFREA
ncbi:hypothetical protein BH18ACI3_BH18ACI3_07900 [soil metagenome]